MVTNYGREEVMHQAGEVVLDGFLVKPDDPSVLFDAIMQVFGQEVTRPRGAPGVHRRRGPGPAALAGARVLLVEDNDINRQVAGEILASVGVSVTMADERPGGNGCRGHGRFDAVLMDVQMPVMDG